MATTKEEIAEMREEVNKVKEENKLLKEILTQHEESLKTVKGVISKMSHYNGNDSVLLEFGLEKWVPGKDDMKKYKG